MDRIFSGIQPTGDLHIGNWLGAVQNWVALQDRFDCIFCVVDLHAVTMPYDAPLLAERTRDMAIGLLAAGIDPSRAILFVQSAVHQHTELNWLLTTVAPLGELERMTQFKDKTGRLESVPVGLLCYPILQAADILLYRADKVPVGEDQVQHLELTREVARRWNAAFSPDSPWFPEPLSCGWSGTTRLFPSGPARTVRARGIQIVQPPSPYRGIAGVVHPVCCCPKQFGLENLSALQ